MIKFQQKKSSSHFQYSEGTIANTEQTMPQQKALDFSYNLTPQKWAWLYQEGTLLAPRKKHILLNFMGADGF